MRRILFSLTVIALLFIPQFAAADDTADLKAAQQKLYQAMTSLDAEGIASMAYPGAVVFGPDAAFPSVLPVENTQATLTPILKQMFTNVEYWRIRPYNMQYRVIGNVGIVWGNQTENGKDKGELAKTGHERVTMTWIKSDGKWYILTSHVSAIPPGN